MTNTQLTLREISTLAEEALIASGASAGAASSLAAAVCWLNSLGFDGVS